MTFSSALMIISIHASTQEATHCPGRWKNHHQDFNPRLHAGGDCIWRTIYRRDKNFNPRLHAGGDCSFRFIGLSISNFNPRLHAGGDQHRQLQSSDALPFQSTPPRRRRQNVLPLAVDLVKFQSTPPRRRRQCVTLARQADINFNPRLHAGGDGRTDGAADPGIYFNPRLHAGGDCCLLPLLDCTVISIHASTQEATFTGGPRSRRNIISIHASTQEATLLPAAPSGLHCYFNPRLHAGGDVGQQVFGVFLMHFNPRLHAGGDWQQTASEWLETISIHASTQEATRGESMKRTKLLFQSTPPRRRRQQF